MILQKENSKLPVRKGRQFFFSEQYGEKSLNHSEIVL